jgi:hypothetical protein
MPLQQNERSMTMTKLRTGILAATATALSVCAMVAAQEREPARQPQRDPAQRDRGQRDADRDQERPGRANTEIRGRAGIDARAGSFLQASTLIGMQVQAVEAEQIGVVKDVLIDPRTCVQYVLLDTKGFVDVDGFVVVPWPLFEFQTAVAARDSSVLLLSVPATRLRTAPVFSSTRVDLAFSAAWVNETNTFFDAELKERRAARPDLDAPDQPDRPGTRPGAPGARPGTPEGDRPKTPEGERPRTPRTDNPPDRTPEPGTPRTPRTPPRSDDPPGTRQPQPPDTEPKKPNPPQPEDRTPETPNP